MNICLHQLWTHNYLIFNSLKQKKWFLILSEEKNKKKEGLNEENIWFQTTLELDVTFDKCNLIGGVNLDVT